MSSIADFVHSPTGFNVPIDSGEELTFAPAHATRITVDAPYESVDSFIPMWCRKCDAPYFNALSYLKCHTRFVCRFCRQGHLQHRPHDGRGRNQEVCSGQWCQGKFRKERKMRWRRRHPESFIEVAKRHRLIPVGRRYITTQRWCVRMRHEGLSLFDPTPSRILQQLYARMESPPRNADGGSALPVFTWGELEKVRSWAQRNVRSPCDSDVRLDRMLMDWVSDEFEVGGG